MSAETREHNIWALRIKQAFVEGFYAGVNVPEYDVDKAWNESFVKEMLLNPINE